MSALLDIVASYRVKYPSGNIDQTIENFSPRQIKEQLQTVFKELEKATVEVNNGVVTFALPSGQKNG